MADWYGEKYYGQEESTDPQGPPGGDKRVLRGGSWVNIRRYASPYTQSLLCHTEHRFLRSMILDAKDLSPEQKGLVEGLLGRSILENESISVRAIEAPVLSDQDRQELAAELRNYFAQIEARRKHRSAEDADEILTEAIRSVRPHYFPHR
jgi:hypothetical protein